MPGTSLLEDILEVVHASEVLHEFITVAKDGAAHMASLAWLLLADVLAALNLVVSHGD